MDYHEWMVLYFICNWYIFQNQVDDCCGGGIHDVFVVPIYARKAGDSDYCYVSASKTVSE